MKEHFFKEICSQCHTIWISQLYIVHDVVLIISYTTKVRIYCLLMMFVGVGIRHLFEIFHKRLHVHHIYN